MDKRKLGAYYNQVKRELDEKLEDADSILSQINDLRGSASTDKESIRQLASQAIDILNDIGSKAEELNTQLSNIDELRAKANDPEQGLEVAINEITDFHNRAEGLKDEISGLRDISKEQNTETKKLKDESNFIHQRLVEIKDDSEDTFKNIEKFYQLAADTGLAGSFDQRKEQLKTSVSTWLWCTIVSTSVLALFLIIMFAITIKDNIDIGYAFSFRIIFISPLIFFILFSANRYSKERETC